jgi:hypothetical protein
MMLLIALALLLAIGPAQTAAPDAAGLYDRGVTWDEFFANVNAQQGTWRTNAGRAHPSDELVDRLQKAAHGLKLLVIAEPGCSDSVNTIPYLAKLAALAGVEMRIVSKAIGAPVMDPHRTPDGRTATPTVILIRDGREAGAWVERPAVLQAWFLSMTGKIDSAERQSRKLAWYDWDRGETTMAEIVALAEAK